VSVSPTLVEVLKRDGVAGVATLSWTYLIYMDWGMRHMDVGMEMVIMPAMQHWTAWDVVLVFLMWAVMMVAMMVPAASPVILLFRVLGYAGSKEAAPLSWLCCARHSLG
jgi:predicted metal-binding membrane protein